MAETEALTAQQLAQLLDTLEPDAHIYFGNKPIIDLVGLTEPKKYTVVCRPWGENFTAVGAEDKVPPPTIGYGKGY